LKVREKGDKERLVPIRPELYKRVRRFAEKTRPDSDSDRIFLTLRRSSRTGQYEPLGGNGDTAPPLSTAASAPTAPPPAPVAPADACHHGGITYCVLNLAVTQATIGSTICVSGWTSTVRPSESYTENLKRQQIASEGLPGGLSNYEDDHRMPLELGGSPADPYNLSPESPASPNPKDSGETSLKYQVCDRQLTSAQAQQQMVANWLAAYPGYKM
jgi:hypothetical protein